MEQGNGTGQRVLRNPLHISCRDSLDDLKTRGNGKLPRSPDWVRCEVVESYESLDDLEQYRSDRLTDKVTSLKDSLDAQYKADERGRVFDRPCQVLDDGDLDEH